MKSDSKCKEFRLAGNKLYSEAKFLDALQAYNKALCYAEDANSKGAALIYAKRSGVYTSLNYPKQSIDNIELACKYGYPEEKMVTLDKRRVKNLEVMMQQQLSLEDDPDNFVKLSYPAHEKIPFMADCMELKVGKSGRGMFATRDLRVGDIVAISEPVFKMISADSVYKRCSNCLKISYMHLIPCDGYCTTMFCSEKCREEAMERFHKYECAYIDESRLNDGSECCGGSLSSYLRIFFESRHIAGGLKELTEICSNIKKLKQKTIFDYDFSNEKDRLLSAFCFFPGEHCHKHDETKLNNQLNAEPLRSAWKSLKEKNDVKMIIKVFKDLNVNPIREHCAVDDEQKSVGTSFSVLAKNFRLSCASNMYHYVIDQKSVSIIKHPIKKGKEIFNTPTLYITIPKNQRNKHIGYKCTCEACVKDFPVTQDLPQKLLMLKGDYKDPFSDSVPYIVTPFNLTDAKKTLQANYKFIEDNIELEPCYELAQIQLENLMVMTRLIGNAQKLNGGLISTGPGCCN